MFSTRLCYEYYCLFLLIVLPTTEIKIYFFQVPTMYSFWVLINRNKTGCWFSYPLMTDATERHQSNEVTGENDERVPCTRDSLGAICVHVTQLRPINSSVTDLAAPAAAIPHTSLMKFTTQLTIPRRYYRHLNETQLHLYCYHCSVTTLNYVVQITQLTKEKTTGISYNCSF